MPQPVRLKMQLPARRQRPPSLGEMRSGTSLCDALDKLLDTGVVVAGELTIKVADVELLYVALELAAGSWESMRRLPSPFPPSNGRGKGGGSARPGNAFCQIEPAQCLARKEAN